MSVRVSRSSADISACSGLMYAGVPMKRLYSVKSVFSVRRVCIALAIPKSMTFTTGRPSCSETITFEGLMSRWMTPFWWAWCTARQTSRKRSSRSAVESPFSSQ